MTDVEESPVANSHFELLALCAADRCDELWAGLAEFPGFLGLEELASAEASPDEGQLFQVPEEFEVLEFGSAAAEKCAQWLNENTRDGSQELQSFKVYFDIEKDPGVRDKAYSLLAEHEAQGLRWQSLGGVDYLENYRRSVRGSVLEGGLWIGPPWDRPPADHEAYIVEPGMAFGTGDHPTTRMCLSFLRELSLKEIQPQGSTYDLGTGSGVLAVALRRYFPEQDCVATDLDPLCEAELLKTFELNKEPVDKVELRFGTRAELRPDERAGLVVSNIYAEVLQQLLPQIAQLAMPGAYWVVSGLLESPALEDFDKAALEYFDLVESRSEAVEKPELSTAEGLVAARQVWHARVFQKRSK